MIDIKLIRSNPKIVIENLRKRGDTEKIKWVEEVKELDEKWRNNLQRMEKLRYKRNQMTQEIAKLKMEKKSASKIIKEVKEIPERIKKLEERNQKYREKIDDYMFRIPNMLHDSVPKGKDENENKVVRKWGDIPKFDFKPQNHFDILRGLLLIDQERANKISGHGFYFFAKELVLLDQALQRYAIDKLMEKGYMLISPPFMMRRKPYEGVIKLDDFKDVIYKIENEDLYMIATGEHPMAALFMNEVLDKKDLPLKFIAVSPCFRKEVGAHGKYTKGLFRMHQFYKVEQFIFSLPEDSWKLHEELQQNSEELYQGLGIPYRVTNVCTGDIGDIAAKKYDIDMWMADGEYREVGSNSNCTDYQARRLNIKYREQEGTSPIGYVHTVNNTALATSRTMVALIERYQQKDGSVEIPKVLHPYMNGIKKLDK